MPFTSLCANLKSESATTPRSVRDRFQRDGGLRTHEVTASPTNLRTPSLTPLTMAVRSAQMAPPAKKKRRECEITGMSATTGWVPGWGAKGRSGSRSKIRRAGAARGPQRQILRHGRLTVACALDVGTFDERLAVITQQARADSEVGVGRIGPVAGCIHEIRLNRSSQRCVSIKAEEVHRRVRSTDRRELARSTSCAASR